jgi:hypothetical protein
MTITSAVAVDRGHFGFVDVDRGQERVEEAAVVDREIAGDGQAGADTRAEARFEGAQFAAGEDLDLAIQARQEFGQHAQLGAVGVIERGHQGALGAQAGIVAGGGQGRGVLRPAGERLGTERQEVLLAGPRLGDGRQHAAGHPGGAGAGTWIEEGDGRAVVTERAGEAGTDDTGTHHRDCPGHSARSLRRHDPDQVRRSGRVSPLSARLLRTPVRTTPHHGNPGERRVAWPRAGNGRRAGQTATGGRTAVPVRGRTAITR